MSRSILLTAAVEDTEVFKSALQKKNISILHYPLERYQLVEEESLVVDVMQRLEKFENIVHGCKRNARFFIKKLKEYEMLDVVREQLNLALDQHTADYLEDEGILAVHPEVEGEAINLMEFMLRIRRLGETLYPCGDKTRESLPGLLQELDMPVQELICFTLEGPTEEELRTYRKDIASHTPQVIIFHSRRSVTRTMAAFPTVNFGKFHVIAGDQAVSDKLQKEEITVDIQAEGSWNSILEMIIDTI